MQLFKTSLLTMLTIFCSQTMLFSITKDEALAVLGLEDDATQAAIRKAYISLMTKWHPDKWANLTPEEQAQAPTKLERIKEAKTKLDAVKEAQDWVQERINTFTDKDGTTKQGFAYWITEWLKSINNNRLYNENPQNLWNFIIEQDIANIEEAINHGATYDTGTLAQEIITLAEIINSTVNPQAKQEEAERLRREAEEQERQARLRRQEEVRLETERLGRETERIRREREERQRKAEEARLKAEQERLRRQEDADERAWREAQRRQEQEAEEQRKEQEANRRQEEARLEAERLHQEQDRIRREAEEADHIRKEAEEADRQRRANSPQAKNLVTQALELAACLK